MRIALLMAMPMICSAIWYNQKVQAFCWGGPAPVTMLDILSVVKGCGVDSELLQVAVFCRFVAVEALSSALPLRF